MPDTAAERVIRGIEMVFSPEVTNETLVIGERKVHVTYWTMSAENGQTRFLTNDADNGSVSVIFNHEEETYLGSFTFGPAGSVIHGQFLHPGTGKLHPLRDSPVIVRYVILDFEYPRFGVIRVDYFDKIMLDLRKSLD